MQAELPVASDSLQTQPLVLVVDDEAVFRKSLSLVLSRDGFKVKEAADSKEAMSVALENPPDLVLLDLHLGAASGYDVLRWLRSQGSTAHVPVVLMTGQAGPGTFRESMHLGADDFLTKPFTADEIRRAVRAKLQRQAAFLERTRNAASEVGHRLGTLLPHELRTPLHSIIGVAELLQTIPDGSDWQEVREFGGLLGEAGRRLLRLVDNFLLFSRFETLRPSHPDELFPQPSRELSILDVVRETAQDRLRALEREADLLLVGNAVTKEMSEEALRKVVDELVDNAAKFSVPGQRIRVAVEPDPAGAVVISVEDEGRGMTALELASVGTFVQVDRPLQEQQGIGLGLSLARRLTELMGGKLEITSERGRGTRVEMRLKG